MITMRTYTRKLGARAYGTNYTPAALVKAVNSVRTGRMSLRKASTEYKVPLGTLHNKITGKCTKPIGAPPRLSPASERHLLTTINHLTDWKVPVDSMDIRLLVKDYLDRCGINDSRFKNNFPGTDWLLSFVKRHKLTRRLADNVKPARAEINIESVSEYFDELEQTLAGIPAERIYNYDETNVVDDPGVKTVVCRRGLKRVERKMQHSNSATSLMYCGNAAGTFLPPMVVYRAANCYSEWTQGGPVGTKYDCTTSGWFDARCFTRWFTEIFIAYTKHQNGTKILIGDNLASHFTHEVIEQCDANDIKFVCLLPNATHLLQPLDVAVFRSLKIEWRKILEVWRTEARVKGAIPKNQFPGLIRKLQNRLKGENISSGFRAAGIFPVDREMVLKRLPKSNRETGAGVEEFFNEAITVMLKKHCGYGEKKKQTRGKKIVPGRPVTTTDLHTEPETSGETSSGTKRKKPARRISSSSSSGDEVELSSSDDDDGRSVGTGSTDRTAGSEAKSTKTKVNSGQWISVAYPGKKKTTSIKFIGQVLKVQPTKATVMLQVKYVRRQPGGLSFVFPEEDDIDDIDVADVIEFIGQPEMNNRQQYIFPGVNPVLYR